MLRYLLPYPSGPRISSVLKFAISETTPRRTDIDPEYRDNVQYLGSGRSTRVRQHAAFGVQRRRGDTLHV